MPLVMSSGSIVRLPNESVAGTPLIPSDLTLYERFRMNRFFKRTLGLMLLVFGGALAPLDAQTNAILREVFTNIPGSSLSDLLNAPAYPNNPAIVTNLTDFFETPENFADNYGQRLRAFLVPPLTGAYIFWIASDDQSILNLSLDDSPGDAQAIASVAGWTPFRSWATEEGQQSIPIHLEAGRYYYVEALMKEGAGGDHLSVRWLRPDGVDEAPIPVGEHFVSIRVPIKSPVITQQPTNTTVAESEPAVFHVATSNLDPLHYQWFRNGAAIPGASQPGYTNLIGAAIDNGARYSVVITNELGEARSDTVTLTVIPDTVPPTVANVLNTGNKTLLVIFSEPVYVQGNISSFALNKGVSILSVTNTADPRVMVLATSPLALRSPYILTVNNVVDRSAAGNPIALNSQKAFFTAEFAPQDIGQPRVAGSFAPADGGFNMTAAGRDIGGASDQFQYSYQERLGNFDLKVRVQTLSSGDPWAKAGLMVRESLDPRSRFAGVLATPSIAGCLFEYRQTTGGVSVATGSFPVNYPQTWLRLKRDNSLFTGYASRDGDTWAELGAVTLNFTNVVYYGLAVSSHSSNSTASVEFRDLGNVVGAPPAMQSLRGLEPLGPSSRRTPLVLSELMYHPAFRSDAKDLEFIELFNSGEVEAELSGYRLGGAVDYSFADGTILPAGGFLVVAHAPPDVRDAYGITNVVGSYTKRLSDRSDALRLYHPLGAVLLEVNYSDEPPWPAAADGAGHSLTLARPSWGEGNPEAWAISDVIGGSPGRAETIGDEPLRSVMINELLANSAPPQPDFLELYNHSTNALDLSGCGLSDTAGIVRFVIPPNTIISGRSFIAFTETQLGFALSSAGETLALVNPQRTRVLDAVKFGATATGVSLGRYADGAPGFRELSAPTFGAANKGLLVRDVVINEVMFNPLSGNADDEYIELFNKGTNSVDLSSWRFVAGVDFSFPANTLLPGGGYLVVAHNAAHLHQNYTNLNGTNLMGDFAGSLSNQGERLALAMPGEVVATNLDQTVTTNRVFIVADELTYRSGGRWPQAADGGGSSFELVDPRSDHRLPANWAPSDEQKKSRWVTIEQTSLLDPRLGYTGFSVDNLELFLLGAGECLLDDVQVIDSFGNVVANPSFESGTEGWQMRGNHKHSTLEITEGFTGRRSLHLRASGRGDTGPNQIITWFDRSLNLGTTATIRAKVRWLQGWPEIAFRLHGNFMEATGRMDVPANLGTPGARNSRAARNAGPALFDVSHWPVLPAANDEPVVVTARVHDPDGLASLVLRYRFDPAISTNAVPMLDDGKGADAVAGDGIYSALIPGQPVGTLIAFSLVATDRFSPPATTSFPSDAPARECLVRFGERVPPGSFGTYRFWITQATFDEWSNREAGSNEPLDATFVDGDFRAVYNIGAYYAGSPFHWTSYDTPTGRTCYYSLAFPADDPLLGAREFILNPPANVGSDPTAQREQLFLWMASQMGLPSTHRRFVNLYVNGALRYAIFEDVQQPNADFLDEWYPADSNGDLHKIEDWFEYDANYGFYNLDATLEDVVTPAGQKFLGRYRWNWRKRAVHGFANDYTNLFSLVDAVNSPTNAFQSAVEKQVDMENWMRTMALRHAVGDWDSYGYRRGKNMYSYKPQNAKWQLLNWDMAFDFGLGDGPTSDLFSVTHFDGSIDPVTRAMFDNPSFRRIYLRALRDIATGPFADPRATQIMDARYAALTANGINVSAPTAIKDYIAKRRAYIQRVLATNEAPFAISSNGGNPFSTNRNVVTLLGSAPLGMASLSVNGINYPLSWTTVSNWVLRLPVRSGSNPLNLVGYDSKGQPFPGAAGSITVTFTGPLELPQDKLVINEIMYHPAIPDAGFVEIFNTSLSQAFDVSGFLLKGVDFAFAQGATIAPQGFLVVAKNNRVFADTYGSEIPLAGQYQGQLKNGGETLRLVQPGASAADELVIDQVTYDSVAPWPAEADGSGGSLQLIDPLQDNNRVSNWAAIGSNGFAPPQWKYVAITGTNAGTRINLSLNGPGEVYLDDLVLVAGIVPENGLNLLKNGNFETALDGSWTAASDYSNSIIAPALFHSGNGSLHLVAAPATPDPAGAVSQDLSPALTPGQYYTLSYWYLPNTNDLDVAVTAGGSDLSSLESVRLETVAQATPGQPNAVRGALPPFAPVYVNELQADNLGVVTDSAGQNDPWLELYNSGSKPVSLAGCFLANTYTNLIQWAFPSNASIAAGQHLIVWLDGQPDQSSASELHTSFRIPTSGSLALIRTQKGLPAVMDYINYPALSQGAVYGCMPDAAIRGRGILPFPTPGAANPAENLDVQVFINEWMADNTATLTDPADGNFEDWFELYNAGTNYVSLAGYSLADSLTNTAPFVIPGQVTIAPHGFLLVWADNETGQNKAGRDLHVDFKLSRGGDSIVLRNASGKVVDLVSFGPQSPDMSQGRWPDGQAAPYPLLVQPSPGSANPAPNGNALRLTSIAYVDGSVALTFQTQPGKTYQVQFKDRLEDAVWQNLGETIVAYQPETAQSDSSLTGVARFYRVVQLATP